ncbi:MAG: 2-oxoacid:ferredoxin oxidoreductase subunit beta [Bacillota bacterium]|jgi:2-oxoglutarate ferredoxin oxidoreductase subunit beta|nr:2-oxoacid:ferredoxin oxidoreductase subunit beta [Bacillota bacterium]HOC06671.1 2-oxoacid:ferredoxin oxidoreductase subunit beta [Bacillota bacterium]HQD20573.1 2-oxoacid:ferredoxin oxidoreductase subunit beta [Bacillota bacterium]
MKYKDFLRKDKMPHIWCPGCGHGMVLSSFLRALAKREYHPDKVAVISGIGCSSRASGYLNFNTLHTTHGRAIPFATGIKMAKPELKVVVLTGDGDSAAIGGNHLIHAARRNIELTVIVFNNNIYGMTSGQYSPLTPHMRLATTAPYGNIDYPFDLVKLAEGAGASFVARGATAQPRHLEKIIGQGLDHNGFSLIEVITQCPTYFGRKNRMGSAVDMLQWQRDNTSTTGKEGKIPLGIFVQEERPEYCANYHHLVKTVAEGKGSE